MQNNNAGCMAKLAMTTICMLCVVSFMFYVASASDPTPLQDFCVGINDPDSSVSVNGEFCKNRKDVTINDFIYKGFDVPGDTNNTQGANATLIDITRFPAVNTQGVSMARVDFAPLGLNTPHLHPRGSEIFAVLEGALYAGFVTTDYKLYDAIIRKGDVIVFPQGLIHFQLNIGNTNAFAMASFGSQNPGRVNVADGVFGTTPRILDDVLTKGLQVDEMVIEQLRAQFSAKNVSVNTGRSILKLLSQTF